MNKKAIIAVVAVIAVLLVLSISSSGISKLFEKSPEEIVQDAFDNVDRAEVDRIKREINENQASVNGDTYCANCDRFIPGKVRICPNCGQYVD